MQGTAVKTSLENVSLLFLLPPPGVSVYTAIKVNSATRPMCMYHGYGKGRCCALEYEESERDS